MGPRNPSFGQEFLLGRAALDLRDFTVSELHSLTGVGENTVYSFLHRLASPGKRYLKSKNLRGRRRGRPRKRYTLTPQGVSYLLDSNSRLAALLYHPLRKGSDQTATEPVQTSPLSPAEPSGVAEINEVARARGAATSEATEPVLEELYREISDFSGAFENPEVLKGFRVLSFAQDILGQSCASYLAGLGAEVIRIEAPRRGEAMRQTTPSNKAFLYRRSRWIPERATDLPFLDAKPSELPEADAIRLAQRGDRGALERIYQLHVRRVYALYLPMVGNTAEAEDLTQEAFLQLFREIQTFRGESAFSTWLHHLAVNVALMHLRKKTLAETSLEETTEPDEETGGPRNEYFISVNFHTPEGQEIVKKLAAKSDVVVEDYPQGTFDSWNTSYRQLSEINPRLVYCRLGRFEARHSIWLADYWGGLMGALRILAALHWRDRVSGEGTFIELQKATGEPGYALPLYDRYDITRERWGNWDTQLCVHGIIKCGKSDFPDAQNPQDKHGARYVMVSAFNDADFKELCDITRLKDLYDRYRAHKDRVEAEAQVEIYTALERWAADKSRSQVVKILTDAGILAAPVMNDREVHEIEHYRQRGTIRWIDDPLFGDMLIQSGYSAGLLSKTPRRVNWIWRPVGADNEYILGKLVGLSSEELRRLEEEKVIKAQSSARQSI